MSNKNQSKTDKEMGMEAMHRAGQILKTTSIAQQASVLPIACSHYNRRSNSFEILIIAIVASTGWSGRSCMAASRN